MHPRLEVPRMVKRRQAALWTWNYTREKETFPQIQRLSWLTKIILRSLGDTVNISPPFNHIEINLKKSVLADLTGSLHQPNQQDFLQFTIHCFLRWRNKFLTNCMEMVLAPRLNCFSLRLVTMESLKASSSKPL